MRTRILIKSTILLIEMAIIYLVVVVVSTNAMMLTDDRFRSRAVRPHVI